MGQALFQGLYILQDEGVGGGAIMLDKVEELEKMTPVFTDLWSNLIAIYEGRNQMKFIFAGLVSGTQQDSKRAAEKMHIFYIFP